MGINSRVGLYYGVLIDQHSAVDKLEYETLEKLISKYTEWSIDYNGMDDVLDYIVVYHEETSQGNYGDHSSKGNYGIKLKPIKKVTLQVENEMLEIFNIISGSTKDAELQSGYIVAAFMD